MGGTMSYVVQSHDLQLSTSPVFTGLLFCDVTFTNTPTVLLEPPGGNPQQHPQIVVVTRIYTAESFWN